jgi:hypothetical protein
MIRALWGSWSTTDDCTVMIPRANQKSNRVTSSYRIDILRSDAHVSLFVNVVAVVTSIIRWTSLFDSIQTSRMWCRWKALLSHGYAVIEMF